MKLNVINLWFSFVCDAVDGWCARKFNQGMDQSGFIATKFCIFFSYFNIYIHVDNSFKGMSIWKFIQHMAQSGFISIKFLIFFFNIYVHVYNSFRGMWSCARDTKFA